MATVVSWTRVHLATERAPAVPYLAVLVQAGGRVRLLARPDGPDLEVGAELAFTGDEEASAP